MSLVKKKMILLSKSERYKLKRINMNVVNRIITVLAENGSDKKTRIALKSNLSYDKCIRYLEWLETIGLIRKFFENRNETWSLSEEGIKWYSKFDVN